MITDKNKKFLAQYGSAKHVNEIMAKSEHPRYMDSDLRLAITTNRHLSPEHIDSLIDVRKPLTTRYIANHPNLNEKHFSSLVNDPDWEVRRNIAKHPKAPEHILNILSGDDHSLVRKVAKENLENRKK
ncbi:MAG TPA: HEAT repeat domain-containing protein [Methanosarcina sp.]|nr:HEAT repeat domain-containing protein [Methanosarcina sp.]